MKTLEHYEGTIDFILCTQNQDLYDKLSERGEKLIEEAELKFLGEYADTPKPLFKELTKEIEDRKFKIKRLNELRAPEVILEFEIQYLKELEEKLKNKEYISFSDKDSLIYHKAHHALKHAFKQSKEYKKVLKEIFEYNEQQVSELYDISEFEKDEDFLKWLES